MVAVLSIAPFLLRGRIHEIKEQLHTCSGNTGGLKLRLGRGLSLNDMEAARNNLIISDNETEKGKLIGTSAKHQAQIS